MPFPERLKDVTVAGRRPIDHRVMNSSKQKPLQPTAEGGEEGGLGGTNTTSPRTMEGKSTSTWFALRNPVFCRLWLASVLSGTFVSSQDVTATWLMD